MIPARTRLQLLAFAVIAVLGVGYLGVRYIGIQRWFGDGGYTVRVNLASGGGLFPQGEVTYRGVTVGRVGSMTLTRTGIRVDLDITSGRPIPADVQAVVADRSVIGEQYLDLRPRDDHGPYLHGGSTIARADTTLPPSVIEVLQSSDSFAASVPVGSLQTVVNELYLATQNSGQNLQTLLDSSKSFFTTADQTLAPTNALIRNATTVLGTQVRTSASIRAFSANLKVISDQLRSSSGDLSKVLEDTEPSLTQANDLLDGVSAPLHVLLGNLLSTSQVFYSGRDGLRQVLVDLPVAVTDAGAVITPQGINTGLVPTFFDPLPCVAGYGSTHVRTGLQTLGDPALNTSAGCTAGSGTDPRGSQHAPGAR